MRQARLGLELWPDEPLVVPGHYDALSLMRQMGLEPDPVQVQIATTPGHQLVLAHRQRGKSRIAAAVAVEDACGGEGRLILLVSRSMRQSGELFRKVREFHHVAQPMALVKDTEHELEYANGSRIISLPASPDTIVGYSSVYRLILDEAARIPDQTYYAVRPMLARSGGRILAISTPFGRRGWFYQEWEGQQADAQSLDIETVERLLADLDFPIEEYSESGIRTEILQADQDVIPWTKIFAPVTYKPQLSKAYIANERRSIPELWFRQEWLCEFLELGEVVFRYEDLLQMVSADVQPFFDADGALIVDKPVLQQERGAFQLGGNSWSH